VNPAVSNRASGHVFALLFCALVTLLAIPAAAQFPANDSDIALVNKFLDEKPEHPDTLKCDIKAWQPFLDFAFRFEAGYIVRCPLREFVSTGNTVVSFVRITPESGTPIVLGDAYQLPSSVAAPISGRARIDQIREELDFSGGFAAGEGNYQVELLVSDRKATRMCRKRWHVHIERKHSEKKVPIAVSDHEAVPLTFLPWNGSFDTSGSGLRLTVLLDAAPVNPYSQKMRAWDRSFLLSALSTVMSQINCQSVRLIAFNMDQQKEIFRKEIFDEPGFSELSSAIRNLELGMVSFQVLEHKQGHAILLSHLANQEITHPEPSDAVILLGPHTRFLDKPPQEFLPTRAGKGPQFFYLEYMPTWLIGREFPDVVEYVTKSLDGTSFKIHSPAELARAVQKISEQVKHDGKQARMSHQ